MIASDKALAQSVNFIYNCMTSMNEIRKISRDKNMNRSL